MDNTLIQEERMSSLEIARITGKEHKNVMQSIRAMEPAWEKVAGLKFQLGSYKDANNQTRACYFLTKTECLYIATKFNDEARAKLVKRWEELERERMRKMQQNVYFSEDLHQMMVQTQQLILSVSEKFNLSLTTINELKPKAEYADSVLSAESCLLSSVIAKDLGMSAIALNTLLHIKRIQYKKGHTWLLYAPYQDKGLADIRTYKIDDTHCREQLVWTEKGRAFINNIVEGGLSPQEALDRVERLMQPTTSKLQLNISFK